MKAQMIWHPGRVTHPLYKEQPSNHSSSVASLDLSAFAEFDNAPPEVWKHELHEIIDQVIERTRNKRNTAEAREETLAIYTNILRAQYASNEVTLRLDELIPAFVKCFKAGSTEREAIYALKGMHRCYFHVTIQH
jgi:hypothetical protein